MNYTTIQIPSAMELSALREFADKHGLQIRRSNSGQIILVDNQMPSNVRRLPARPSTGPELGGAA